MNRNFLLTVWYLIFLGLYPAGGLMAQSQAFPVQEAQEALNNGARLIDVRQPDEYADGHAPHSQNIPHDELANQLEELGNDKSQPIVVYCRSGARSSYAKDLLEAKGFTNVINAGGLPEIRSIVDGWNIP
jgi:phage shock protein E